MEQAATRQPRDHEGLMETPSGSENRPDRDEEAADTCEGWAPARNIPSFPLTLSVSFPPPRFITKKGRELCANPSESWVREYMNDLELN